MSVRFIRGALTLVLLAVLTPACGEGSTDSGTDPTVEPTAGTPSAEGTGPEPPITGGEDKPAIETAKAPAGAARWDTLTDGSGNICIGVKWLGQPDGASASETTAFKVTEIRVDGAEAAAFPCKDPCLGYTFDSNSDICYHPVIPGTSEGTLAVFGQVVCTQAQACEEFKANLKPKSIPVPSEQTIREECEESGECGPTPSPTPTSSPSPEPTESPDTVEPTDTEEPTPGE